MVSKAESEAQRNSNRKSHGLSSIKWHQNQWPWMTPKVISAVWNLFSSRTSIGKQHHVAARESESL